jgi:hypothetical protein
VQIPTGVPAGNLPLILTFEGITNQSNVLIPVQ